MTRLTVLSRATPTTRASNTRASIDSTRSLLARDVARVALAASLTILAPEGARGTPGQRPEPLVNTVDGCTVRALDAFADVRAKFSLEVSAGAMPEAVLTLTGCDYGGAKLRGKILSGAVADGTNFEGAEMSETEMSRTSARDSNLRNVDFRSANAYEARFDGSDLRGANFENALLSNASFGRGANGTWANLDGANFEGALVSSSDARKLCENPTLDVEGQIAVGGC